MYIYRKLTPISAITFDLDDTLYDNKPVMDKTEKELLNFIRSYDIRFSTFQFNDFKMYQTIILKKYPDIYHNVTYWRWLAAKLLLLHYGYSYNHAILGANKIISYFLYWRSQINIPKFTHKILSYLSKKIPLAVITNGNANPSVFGLGNYFQFVLQAGKDGRAKPFSDMYYCASQKFNIKIHSILHVGDSLDTDIQGALDSGMQACWLNSRKKILSYNKISNKFPHVEIKCLASLIALI
ncbi:MAG: 5-amino-6-(5-phospho-D-ribitylamino)uracil phosphatase YigB [Arsenophonus sp.]|nr:MAG: 5-amino-6-(5-phospho-D-ribitylamino)uracil phosphatase YigB [Arsenophonus sp.]